MTTTKLEEHQAFAYLRDLRIVSIESHPACLEFKIGAGDWTLTLWYGCCEGERTEWEMTTP